MSFLFKHKLASLLVAHLSNDKAAFFFELTIMLIVGIVVVPLIKAIMSIFKELSEKVTEADALALWTCAFLVYWLLMYPQKYINPWGSLWYATDYSMGLGSRFFIGSVLKLFYGDYLHSYLAVMFCYVFIIFIIVIVALLGRMFYLKCEKETKTAFLYIWFLFLVNPGSLISHWYTQNMFGRLETYGLFIGLLCLMIYAKAGLNVITVSVITFLSCISIAIYQGNIFMYYSLILMVFIWEIVNDPRNIRKWIYGVINTLFTALSFVLFQFFSYTMFSSVDEMTDYLSSKTNISINRTALNRELFLPLSESYIPAHINYFSKVYPRESSFVTMLFLCPTLIMFVALYMKCYRTKRVKQKNVFRLIYTYFICLLFMIVPQYILNVDWGRWMVSTTIVLFLSFLFLLWKQDEGAVAACQSFSNWIHRHKILCLIVLVFTAGLGKMSHYYYIDQVSSIIKWMVEEQWIVSGL